MAGCGRTAARPRVLSRRILHVRSSRSLAGPERHLLELLPGLVARGIDSEVALLYRRRPGDAAQHPLLGPLAEAGIPAFQIRDPDRLGLASRRALVERLRHGDLAALHGHDPKSNWVISRALAAREVGRGIRRVATLHLYTRTTPALRLYRRVDLRLLRRFDGGTAVATFLAAELAPGSRIPAIQSGALWRVIANGIDAQSLRRRAEAELAAARTELAGITGHRAGFVLVAAGRLTRQKGIDLLLEALAALPGRLADLVLLVAGEGPERAALERRAERLRLGERVRFLGERRDLAALLAAANGFVLPSRGEGSPYALLEAMALGVPVVAAEVGGVAEMLGGGTCGALVPAGDRAALGAGIAQLLEVPEEARRRAERAREAVAGRLSAARMADETAAFYADVLGGNAVGGPAGESPGKPA